jgi:uncharacterized protein (DUF433 family)
VVRLVSPAHVCQFRISSIISKGGDSIEDFLEGFPSVSREQVIAFLEEAKDRMVAQASA